MCRIEKLKNPWLTWEWFQIKQVFLDKWKIGEIKSASNFWKHNVLSDARMYKGHWCHQATGEVLQRLMSPNKESGPMLFLTWSDTLDTVLNSDNCKCGAVKRRNHDTDGAHIHTDIDLYESAKCLKLTDRETGKISEPLDWQRVHQSDYL